MGTSDERKRRGQEAIKRYRSISGTDSYAAAADAITDILLSVSENEEEASQILHAAEADFRQIWECENFAAEG